MMVFPEQAEKSPQLGAGVALQQSLALRWVFRQRPSGICSRAQGVPGSTGITSHPQRLLSFPLLCSKLPNHLLLLPKGLDLAKQRSYKGVSQVQAQILTCINGEFGTARLSEQLFGFLLLSFLEREGEWITSKS